MRTSTGVLPGAAPNGHRVRAGLVYEAWEPSSRDPSVKHRVTCDAEGSWDCTCEAVEYGSRADGGCRHIDKHKVLASRPPVLIPGFT